MDCYLNLAAAHKDAVLDMVKDKPCAAAGTWGVDTGHSAVLGGETGVLRPLVQALEAAGLYVCHVSFTFPCHSFLFIETFSLVSVTPPVAEFHGNTCTLQLRVSRLYVYTRLRLAAGCGLRPCAPINIDHYILCHPCILPLWSTWAAKLSQLTLDGSDGGYGVFVRTLVRRCRLTL